MPGKSCSLCKRSWDQTVSMFAPPRDEYIRGEWEAACGVRFSVNSRICAKHFSPKDIATGNLKRTRLTPDAVPSLNLSPTPLKRRKVDESLNFTDNCRKIRATVDQLYLFVNFARMHPKILTTKFGAVSDLWVELAIQLNALEGAHRTPEKWKESMGMWRSQLRHRARHGRSSGVAEFDEFALCNFGQQAVSGNEEGELRDLEMSEDEIVTYLPKNLKEIREEDIKVEIVLEERDADILVELQKEIALEPEADVEIKKEIDWSDDDFTNNLAEECKVVSEHNEVTLDFETEIDIKPDIEILEDENAPSQLQTSTELLGLPTLGFPCASRADIFATTDPTPATTHEHETGKKNGFLTNQTIPPANNSNKTFEENIKERKIVIHPRPKTTISNKTAKKTVGGTDKNKRGLTLIGQEKVNKERGIVVLHNSHADASNVKRKVNNNIRPSNAKNTAAKVTEAARTEIFTTENSSQAAPSPIPEKLPNASTTNKSTTLTDMYETILKSMKKRDEREEQIMTVLQGLTVAVTKLTDSVKRLGDVLTVSTND